jgi:hypothetical protein
MAMTTTKKTRKPLQNVSNLLAPQNRNKAGSHDNATVKPLSRERLKPFVDPPKKIITPYDCFMARLENVMRNEYNTPGTTSKELRAAIVEGDPGWKPQRAKYYAEMDRSKWTEAEVHRLQVIILPRHRRETMEEMGQWVLGTQYGQDGKVFTASFASAVLRAFSAFMRRYSETECFKQRCDLLLGFSYEIFEHDYWMTHHPRAWGGEKMVASLAVRWKHLLQQCSAEELGLDKDFSFPALQWLLVSFKTKVESVETYGDPKMVFDYM